MNLINKLQRIGRTWAINTINTAVYTLSGGKTTLHEGRYAPWRGTWLNWSRTFESQPDRFEKPRTEEEICRLVKAAKRVRVVGGGHTFNASPLTNGTMISLDDYNQILSVDQEKGIVRVQAGIRLRDLTEQLDALGLAFPVLGSTNSQSLGGLIATDLHGTGRDHGFLSEQVLSLRIVNSAGEAKTYRWGSDEFHAAIGAIGTCGLVTEIELKCEPAFNLERAIQIVDRDWVDNNIDRLLEEHDHLSFYYIGGVDVRNVRMNIWNRTPKAPSFAWKLWKLALELLDMLLTGYLLGLSRVLKIADLFANVGLLTLKLFLNHESIVFPSAPAFARKLYYHHNELEYGVPYSVHRQCLKEVLDLLRERRFVTVIEIRFTPDQSQALLGPGVGRRTCFIELAPSLSVDESGIFAEVEQILLKYGGQVHLGKATNVTGAMMRQMYKEQWRTFRKVQQKQDPEGKFVNDFVARVFEDDRTLEERKSTEAPVPLRAAS